MSIFDEFWSAAARNSSKDALIDQFFNHYSSNSEFPLCGAARPPNIPNMIKNEIDQVAAEIARDLAVLFEKPKYAQITDEQHEIIRIQIIATITDCTKNNFDKVIEGNRRRFFEAMDFSKWLRK